MTDFNQISDQARVRLVGELRRSVANVSAAVDEAAETVLDAADARRQTDLAVARVRYLAGEGLEPLRELSAGFLKRAGELDYEVSRLDALAAEAAKALRARQPAREPSRLYAVSDPAPSSPLDQLAAQGKAIAGAQLDFRPRKPLRRGPATEPVEIQSGLRLVIEQMRVAGVTERTIAERLEALGVADPDTILARV